jgi:hypothetical protein
VNVLVNVLKTRLKTKLNRLLPAATLCLGIAIAQVAPGQESPDASNPALTGEAPLPRIAERDDAGRTVYRARLSGHVTNYYEDRIPTYTLPDPLTMDDGRTVVDADMWLDERREEILRAYQSEIYGNVPETAPQVEWAVAGTDPEARNGTAVMKRVVGRMGEAPDAPAMNVTVYTPSDAAGPVPIVLTITFGGGDGGGRGRGGGNGAAVGPGDPIDDILARGWGYATVGYRDIEGDTWDTSLLGVRGAALRPGQTRPDPDEWGTISAWAWGISRIVDYFETDEAVDAGQIAIEGHSRLGKTVLWAAAQDERIAAVFASCGGEMGPALIRRDYGETLDDMAYDFYWQFSGNLQKYVGRWDEVPGDQHFVISLVAPRPVFLNGGLGDQWSDPVGEFLSAVAAGPVYELLGREGLGTTELPPMDSPIIDGDIGWNYHGEGHVATPEDWAAFLGFLDKYFE